MVPYPILADKRPDYEHKLSTCTIPQAITFSSVRRHHRFVAQYMETPIFASVDTLFISASARSTIARSSFFVLLLALTDRMQLQGTSGVPKHFNRADTIEHIEVALPRTEQTPIAAVLADMDAELAALEHGATRPAPSSRP